MSARVDRWRSQPRAWAVTAAGCAGIVGLVGWPWPALYALGLLAGASILLAGTRLLLTERREPPADDHTAGAPAKRCCVCGGTSTVYENCYGNWFCWPCADCPCGQIPCVRTGINDPAVSSAAAEGPTCQCAGVGFGGRGDCPVHDGPTTADASGQHPETARTHPDAGEQQPADQAGDHPDDLRNRIADAIRHALKTRTLPAIVDYAGRPMPGTAFGLTEHDLADVALAELAPELAQDAEVRRLGLMVDEYAAGARGISDKLRQARTMLRETEGQLAETRGRLAARRQDRLRADQAEQTIANVRRATDDARQCLNDLDPTEHPRPCGMCGTDHLAAVEAALDRPVIVEGA